MNPRFRPLFILLLATGCDRSPTSEGGGVFVVDVAGERYRILITDAARRQMARAHLASGRVGVVGGRLERGDGGVNRGYGWHVHPASVEFPDAAMEVCDGRPSDVQSDVDYWVDTVQRYCPWGARLIAEE